MNVNCSQLHVFSPLSVPFSAPGSNYWLIGTDYDTYSSVYACIFGLKLAWIMTKDRYPNREVVGTACAQC
jgi:hypothetical protein